MVGYKWSMQALMFVASAGALCAREVELPVAASFHFDSPSTQPVGIEGVMRVWAYVQDLNRYAHTYSQSEYDLCVYSVVGMLLCAQSALQTQQHISDDERVYYTRIISLFEQECGGLRLSLLQSRLMKESLNAMRMVLR